MNKVWMVALAGLLPLTAALAQHEGHGSKASTVVLKITGLHCEACPPALEEGLMKLPGVEKARVSLKDGIAEVSYRDNQVCVQEIAQAVAATKSPMPDGKFEGALLLRAKGVKTDEQAYRLTRALDGVDGVRRAETLSRPDAVAITFADRPAVRLSDLEAAADRTGYTLEPLSAKDARKLKPASDAAPAHEHGGSGHDGGHSSGHGCCG